MRVSSMMRLKCLIGGVDKMLLIIILVLVLAYLLVAAYLLGPLLKHVLIRHTGKLVRAKVTEVLKWKQAPRVSFSPIERNLLPGSAKVV